MMLSLLLAAPLLLPDGHQDAREAANTSGVPFPAPPAFATDEPAEKAHGTEVAAHADRYDRGYHRRGGQQGEMTLLRRRRRLGASAPTAAWCSRTPSRGTRSSCVKFLTPAEIKGVAALTHEQLRELGRQLALPAGQQARAAHLGCQQDGQLPGHRVHLRGPLEPRGGGVRLAIPRAGRRWSATATSVPVLQAWRPSPTYKDTGYSRIIVSYNADNEWRLRAHRVLRQGRTAPQDPATPRSGSCMHGRFWRAGLHRHDQPPDRQAHGASAGAQNLPQPERSTRARSTGKARPNLDDSALFTTQALQL